MLQDQQLFLLPALTSNILSHPLTVKAFLGKQKSARVRPERSLLLQWRQSCDPYGMPTSDAKLYYLTSIILLVAV